MPSLIAFGSCVGAGIVSAAIFVGICEMYWKHLTKNDEK